VRGVSPSAEGVAGGLIGGDPEQEFFADGIAGDIITALSRYPSLLRREGRMDAYRVDRFGSVDGIALRSSENPRRWIAIVDHRQAIHEDCCCRIIWKIVREMSTRTGFGRPVDAVDCRIMLLARRWPQ